MNNMNSIHIANSVGAPNKAPILVTEDYNHWATRFQGYMMGKDQEIWRSMNKDHTSQLLLVQQQKSNLL